MLSDAPSHDAASSLGARVRALRRARGLTLKALGARAGLSHPFLSQVERSLARPSLDSIERIAEGLEVPVAELWADSPAPASPRLVRHAEGRTVPHVVPGAPGALRELSAPGESLSAREWSGGSRSWPEEPVVAAGEVMVYVIRGGVEVDVAGDVHPVGEGDALLFAGRLPHRMRRTGSSATRALVVLSA